MTEKGWMECTDPWPMVHYLCSQWNKFSHRKLRLFSLACCRRIWHLLTDKRSRLAVEVGERYAEGLATREELSNAREAARAVIGLKSSRAATAAIGATLLAPYTALDAAVAVGRFAAQAVKQTLRGREEKRAKAAERCVQCNILRCIVGNPFHAVTIDQRCLTWNDGAVRKLAQAIYDERRFDDLPVLADALEDAGCDDAAVLGHCRGPGPHVRGCWVVDLILGKE
jgi:hypothetical protein